MKRKKQSRTQYLNSARKVKKYHNFSFDLSKKLTSHQKAAITKAVKRFKYVQKLEKDDRSTFYSSKQLKGINRKNLPTNTKKTNKGFFIRHSDAQKIRILKISGKKTVLLQSKTKGQFYEDQQITYQRRIFIPLDREINNWKDVDNFIAMIYEKYDFENFSLSINGNQTITSYYYDGTINTSDLVDSPHIIKIPNQEEIDKQRREDQLEIYKNFLDGAWIDIYSINPARTSQDSKKKKPHIKISKKKKPHIKIRKKKKPHIKLKL